MGRGAGRVVLLALVLLLALQTPASADKKFYVIFFKDYPLSLPALLSPLTNNDFFELPYDLRAISAAAVQIDSTLASQLKKLSGVLDVVPDSLVPLHTTRSWNFLRLASNGQGQPTSAWSDAGFGAGTIIGNIDTGVWPESPSFQDDGLDIPSGWCGTCDKGSDTSFQCNKKLIGARYFSEGIRALIAAGALVGGGGQQPSQEDLSSPRDFEGHGSHTLSTAGGGFVGDASVLGHGKGTAAGGSPRARVAAYKACYAAGCSSIDVLAAIVAAVKDGVHVLSLSLGAPATDYVNDLIAIGTFYAVQKGITVVCSAGNSGPQPGTASNIAPWILTVGASTMDRDFPAYVTYGVETGSPSTIQGQSLADSTTPIGQAYPMISGADANAANQPANNSSLCLPASLDSAKVSGKIVVCVRGVNARVEKGFVVQQAGGVGMVLCNDPSTGDTVIADAHLIPAAHLPYSKCPDLLGYLQGRSTSKVGFINATNASFGVKPAPKMAAFSSRGPNPITPQILKPDITAPGVSVIAAYSGAVSPTGLPFDKRRVAYDIMSGTSMSCPHVSGVAGLLRAKYPDWSPAMIKSAIMTSASTVADDGKPIQDETGAAATPFSYGSGHVDPVRALDPGLVYDTTLADYTDFLCSLKPTQDPTQSLPVDLPGLPGFTILPLFSATGEPCACSKGPYGRPEDLNYPSIAVPCLRAGGSTTVKRRVKNVGEPGSRYTVTVTNPRRITVTVEPKELYFASTGDEKEFVVTLNVVDAAEAADYVFGGIEWSSVDAYGASRHRVRSPIAAKTKCG